MLGDSEPLTPIAPTEVPISGRIPPVDPPAKSWWRGGSERDERSQLERDGSQSHNVRRIAAYGGMLVAGILYLGGLAAIGLVLGLCPKYPRVAADMWHIVVAVLVALFTVPTVLLVSILKVMAPSQETEIPATVHEAMGKMIEKLVDKVCD